MTTTATAPAPPHPSSAPPPPPQVVVLRRSSSKLAPSVVEQQHHSFQPPKLKTLSSDLGDLLVKNLRRPISESGGVTATEKCFEESFVFSEDCNNNNNSVDVNSDSVNLIRSKPNNRNSLCDTFSSVNKLIKLKRVSSDSSSISAYSKIGSGEQLQQHSINPPPQAKFKRVEISVQELPAEEVVSPRGNIIVNQFEQLGLDESLSESVPLLVEKKSVPICSEKEETEVENPRNPLPPEEIAARVLGIESGSSGKVCRRIAPHPLKARGGSTTLEAVEEEHYYSKRRSLQWPLGFGGGGQSGQGGDSGWSDNSDSEITIFEEAVDGGAGAGLGVGEERRRRKSHFRHSWNAPGYDLLLEEDRGFDSKKDFASIVHNLAGLRSALANGGSHESASLLEPNSPQFSGPKPSVMPSAGGAAAGGGTTTGRRSTSSCVSTSPVVPPMTTTTSDSSHPAVSLGGPVPRKRRLEAFLKSLVGRRPSKEPPPAPPPPPPPPQSVVAAAAAVASPPRLSSPEIKVSKTPSEHNLVEMTRSRLNISTTSLSSVHQKLWSVVPLLKKDVSCNSLAPPKSVPMLGSQPSPRLRKCETVLALTGSGHAVEPIKPQNRLRNCASVATCSRCSSLLSLAAAGSRYSLNLSNGGFVPVAGGGGGPAPPGIAETSKRVGSLIRLTKTSSGTSSSSSSPCASSSSPLSTSPSGTSSSPSSSSSSSSRASVTSKVAMLLAPPSPVAAAAAAPPSSLALNPTVKFTCKLCLGEYSAENLTRISQCGCSFCTECMTAYIEFEISEGAYEVSCPDAMCPAQGIITIGEITTLAASSLVEKHHRYRLNREVELDKFRTWCPKAGCETICLVGQSQQQQQQQNSNASSDRIVQLQPSSPNLPSPCAVHCPTCREDFCSGCKKAWHPTMSCEENTRRLAADGQTDALGIPFDNDLIKCCPMCAVPIEKDEGCAQMMCKRCKHVFCWYCLASLDDDFLLRHYDKGPCKNKLGHSRASVVWHRAQVIGIFAGFGILLLVASPLLLLAAPCIVCCKCRICSGAAKLEETDVVDYDDAAVALQSQR